MSDPAARARELQRLMNLRDLAAYRVVAAVDTVLLFWETQDYDASRARLERARADYARADQQITDFHKFQHSEGDHHHGNRSAA